MAKEWQPKEWTKERVNKMVRQVKNKAIRLNTKTHPMVITENGKEYYAARSYDTKAERDKLLSETKAFAKKWGISFVTRKVNWTTRSKKLDPKWRTFKGYALFIRMG